MVNIIFVHFSTCIIVQSHCYTCMLSLNVEVVVTSVSSGMVFLDPANIVVRVTSDLTIEVRCIAMNRARTDEFSWYRNEVVVPIGLQVFGVSQRRGGILRVHPATELDGQGGRNEFMCTNGTASLTVVFNIGESPSSTPPP